MVLFRPIISTKDHAVCCGELYDLFRMPVCFRSSKEKKAKVPRKISGVTQSVVRVIY